MAVAPTPKKTKGIPPSEKTQSNTLTKKPTDELIAFNFKVSASFRREFKAYALEHDMTGVELLKEMFEYYRETHK